MRKIYAIVAIFSIFTFSCVKDNTVTSFNEVNEVTIEDMKDLYEVDYGTELVIEPTITTALNDDSNLGYIWYKYLSSGGVNSADTISYEKNLKVTEELGNVIPGIAHKLALKVYDKKTGFYTLKTVDLKTVSSYADGLIALGETAGNYDLTYCSNKTNVIKSNIYPLANSGENLSNASTRVFFANGSNSNISGTYGLIVAANDPTGGAYLDYNTMTKQYDMTEKIGDDFGGANIDITSYAVRVNGYDAVIANGNLYARINPYWDYSSPRSFDNKGIVKATPTDFDLADIVLGFKDYSNGLLAFDKKHGRLLAYSGNANALVPYSPAEADMVGFDPNNLGENIEVVTSGYYSAVVNGNITTVKIWFITKENGKLYNYVFNLGSYNVPMSFDSKTELPSAVTANILATNNVGSSSFSYISGYNQLYSGILGGVFYTNNNNLYLYDMANNNEIELTGANPNNYEITTMLVSNFDVTEGEGATATTTTYSRVTLGLKDTSASGLQGKIANYTISTVGGYNVTETFVSEGFCDEVVSITNKPV